MERRAEMWWHNMAASLQKYKGLLLVAETTSYLFLVNLFYFVHTIFLLYLCQQSALNGTHWAFKLKKKKKSQQCGYNRFMLRHRVGMLLTPNGALLKFMKLAFDKAQHQAGLAHR